jgi:UPF0716 protein FxsA
MGRLLLLFIVLPAVELALLIEIGQRIGTLATLSLIVASGVVGAALARSQGLQVLSNVRTRVNAGELPADSLLDGLLILIASALLVTPGVLTDAFGFVCLIPACRGVLKREILRRLQKAVAENRVRVEIRTDVGGPGTPRAASWNASGFDHAIDVTPETRPAGESVPKRDLP